MIIKIQDYYSALTDKQDDYYYFILKKVLKILEKLGHKIKLPATRSFFYDNITNSGIIKTEEVHFYCENCLYYLDIDITNNKAKIINGEDCPECKIMF